MTPQKNQQRRFALVCATLPFAALAAQHAAKEHIAALAIELADETLRQLEATPFVSAKQDSLLRDGVGRD